MAWTLPSQTGKETGWWFGTLFYKGSKCFYVFPPKNFKEYFIFKNFIVLDNLKQPSKNREQINFSFKRNCHAKWQIEKHFSTMSSQSEESRALFCFHGKILCWRLYRSLTTKPFPAWILVKAVRNMHKSGIMTPFISPLKQPRNVPWHFLFLFPSLHMKGPNDCTFLTPHSYVVCLMPSILVSRSINEVKISWNWP